MLSRLSSRLRRPSPAMLLACVALVVALGGVGYAATKLPKNSVGSKQLKKHAVTPSKVSSATLKRFRGRRGKAGAKKVTVRSTNLTFDYSCSGSGSSYSCTAPPSSATAHCAAGERATGGGYGKSNDGQPVTVTEDTPTPANGTPTGWTVSGSVPMASSPTSSHAPTVVPVRVACAAP